MPRIELEKIARLAAILREGTETPGVTLGIGDDAAVLKPASRGLVWTIDEQTEGTHFRRTLAGWADVGYRSFMAAASDIAAMGADPWCALSALALPADFGDEAFDDLVQGQRLAADAVAAPIVGGNLARAVVVSVTTTLLGSCDRPVARSGARPGDRLWMAGQVGLARAGLLALDRGKKDRRLTAAIAAWLRPEARIADGREMGKVARAAIDVSDGLARDATQVAVASGVSLVLDAARLVEHGGAPLARAAEVLGVPALELALHGGEDYALLAASDVAIPGFVVVGEVREGEGLILRDASGERAIAGEGFDHFG